MFHNFLSNIFTIVYLKQDGKVNYITEKNNLIKTIKIVVAI